jgi:uncharacterized protein DUF2188
MSVKRTVHVYRSNGVWAVQKEGVSAQTFPTRREAATAARQRIRRDMGQFVVHGPDGGIREYETHGMTPVQNPPGKSRLAKRIGRAVGKVALRRLQSDQVAPSAGPAKK